MKGAKRCYLHARGKEADKGAAVLAAAAMAVIQRGTSPLNLYRAERTLARIARRQLHKDWKHDPRLAGSTLALDARLEQAVADWLFTRHQIKLNQPLPGSSEPPTARCADRLRWAAYRAIKRGSDVDPDFLRRADLRVSSALRDDSRFWQKLAKLDAWDA